MPPKKKGKSKTAEELKRQAEEAQKIEQLRKQRELELQLAKDKEQLDKFLTEKIDSLNEEVQKFNSIVTGFSNQYNREYQALADEQEWQLYKSCCQLPDLKNEAQVNTFLNLLDQEPVVENEEEPDLTKFYQELGIWDELSEKPQYMSLLLESEKSWQKRYDSKADLMPELAVPFRVSSDDEHQNNVELNLESPPVAPAAFPSEIEKPKAKATDMLEFQRQLLRIKAILQRKWDSATSVIISNLESFRTETSAKQENFHYTKFLPGYVLGVFVNTSKNPRFKTIEFDQKIITATLPKSLALQSIAVRALHAFGNTASAAFELQAEDQVALNTVGGILHLDLFTLPNAPIKVGKWTIRAINGAETILKQLAYPFRKFGQPLPEPISTASVSPTPTSGADNLNGSQTSNATHEVSTSVSHTGIGAGSANNIDAAVAQQYAFQVTYSIKISPFLDASKLRVMWWDGHTSQWSTAGILEQDINLQTGLVQFKTLKFAPHAVLTHKYQEIPYRGWQLAPENPDKLVLTIYGAVNKIDIAITSQGCTLVNTKEANKQPESPRVFLSLLSRVGLGFVAPPTASGLQDTGMILKHPSVEASLIRTISACCRGFAFRSTHANSRLGTFAGALAFQAIPPGSIQQNPEVCIEISSADNAATLVAPTVTEQSGEAEERLSASEIQANEHTIGSQEPKLPLHEIEPVRTLDETNAPADQVTETRTQHELPLEEQSAALHADSRYAFPANWKTLVVDTNYVLGNGNKLQVSFVAPTAKFSIEPGKFPLNPSQLHATPYQAIESDTSDEDFMQVKKHLESTPALLEHNVRELFQLTGLLEFS